MPSEIEAREPTVEELKRELSEARDHHTATSEILRVISISPSNAQPVFAEIAKSSARLCDAYDAIILLKDGDLLRHAAHEGPIPIAGQLALQRGSFMGRAVLEHRTIHVADLQAEIAEYPVGSEIARRLGHRTMLAVPLMRAGKAIGVIALRRLEKRPFSERQIELLRTLADQAVIAIENTRLFEAEQASKRELQESLEYQTATSEVLGVISRSPTELRPVLDTIARTSQRLCEADRSSVWRLVDRAFELAAISDHSAAVADYMARQPIPANRTSVAGRCVLEKRTVHVHDRLNEPGLPPLSQSYASDTRTLLCVPLLRKGEPIGVVRLSRDKVAPFTPRQIALVETFADQAVIAIENTRLFEAEQARTREVEVKSTELVQSLEYQTAISEVLSVISRSPNELQPVFNTIVASSKRLLRSHGALVTRVVGQELRLAAFNAISPEADRLLQNMFPLKLDGTNPAVAALRERTPFVVQDSKSEVARRRGFRSLLIVPMLSKGEAIGAVHVSRPEPGPFSDEEIGLLKTFADQAVIAIENTRLFEAEQASKRELQESLEYQTAIAKVLSVISSSPNDLQPVFDVIVEIAHDLCEADYTLFRKLENGGFYRVAASKNADPAFLDWAQAHPMVAGDGSTVGLVAAEKRTIHQPDALGDPKFTDFEGQQRSRARTRLGVPLLHAGEVIGVIFLARYAVRPFSGRQIDLVTTFADQAVIAIENTRLFEAEQARTRELQQALDYQTATSKVLELIGRSPGALEPIFQAMLEHATRLCDAKFGIVFEAVDGGFRALATRGAPKEFADYAAAVRAWGTFGDLVRAKRIVHIDDISARPIDEGREPNRVVATSLAGIRTIIVVPMLKDDDLIGALSIYRTEVRPFSDRQIALLTAFTQQAVIAIENTRLFEEAQARTRDLTEALEQQTATADVLKVISRSALDVQKALDALVESAARLCNAYDAAIFQAVGDGLRGVAHYGQIPFSGETRPLIRGFVTGRAILDRRTIQIADSLAEADEYPESHKYAIQLGYRTALAVPLVHAGEAIGVILIRRGEVRPFTERQIELVNTFADQAVIAIENTRLFEEVQARTRELGQALEYQTAISDVLGVIGRSKFDLQPVLTAIVSTACRLCDAHDASIALRQGEWLEFAAGHGSAWVNDEWINNEKLPIVPGLIAGRAVLERKPIHIHDVTIAGEDFARSRELAISRGHRTALAVPLLREEQAIGCLFLRRIEVRPFSEKQVVLLETFADQAVIAIENVRLFEEIARKSRELEIASQHKSQFVANMSHELRTPLAAILGYAELIQEGFYEPQGPKSLDALTRIRSNGKHLLGLINTVLDIAKIESGQFTLNMSEYAIESVVETVRAATESLAQNKKLTLTTTVDKSLPVGLGDEQRLTQVLLNLVGNAIKFTDAGEVSIAAGARNGHFAVSVTDTGPGIPLDQQDRIFEQFHQVDSSNTKAKGGTGLGLAIAKQIVEMHGGRIWVESTLGKGSTFQMEIPARAEFPKRTL